MDKTYQGFWMKGLPRRVTEKDIIDYIIHWIGKDPTQYVNGEPHVQLFETPATNNSRNALVSGVRKSLRELEMSFKWHLLCQSPVIIRGPDFGIQTDKLGNFSKAMYPTHVQLMEGNGFLYPVDIFNTGYVENFGDFGKLRRSVYINKDDKNALNTKDLQGHGMIYFNRTINPFTSNFRAERSNKKLPYNCTEIHFRCVLEAFQAICHYNGTKNLWRFPLQHPNEDDVPFFTTASDPINPCLAVNCGVKPKSLFGKGETFLDCSKFIKLGYVPFQAFRRGVISPEKLENYKYTCPDCKKNADLLGVDLDLCWIAAKCSCCAIKLNARGIRHGNDNFIRLAIPSRKRDTAEKDDIKKDKERDEESIDDEDISPFAIMQCLKPVYSSVRDCILHVLPAYIAEYRKDQADMAKQDQSSQTVIITPKETVEVKGKWKDIYQVEIVVEKNVLWTETCKTKIGKIYLTSNMEKMMPLKAIVYELEDHGDTCSVWIEVMLPKGSPYEHLYHVRAVPKPPSATKKGIGNAFKEWEENDYILNTMLPNRITRIVSSTELGKDDRLRACLITIKLPCSETITAIRGHLKQGYVGVDASLIVKDEKNSSFPFFMQGRILGIMEYHGVANIEFVINLPLNYSIEGPELRYRMWALDIPEAVNEKPLNNPIPGGMEDDDNESDYDDEDADSDEDLDELLMDETFEDRIERKSRSNDNPPTPQEEASKKGYFLSLRLKHKVVPLHRNSRVKDLLYSRKGSPLPDISLGIYLLEGQETRDDAIPSLRSLPTPPARTEKLSKIRDIMRGANMKQREAIVKFFTHRLSITQGPPGCGKTKTASSGACYLHIKEYGYIIVVAPTNAAADVCFNDLKEVSSKYNLDMKIMRMAAQTQEKKYKKGDPKIKYCKDYVHIAVEESEEWKENKELKEIRDSMKHSGVNLRRSKRQTLRNAKKRIAVHLMRDADVIVCTLAGAGDQRMKDLKKSLVDTPKQLSAIICDESSLIQVHEVIQLINLAPKRLWVLGDHLQLSPSISHFPSKLACMGISWMEYLMLTPYVKRNDIFTFLEVQYRAEMTIASRTSDFMYDGKMRSSDLVTKRPYTELKAKLQLDEFKMSYTILYAYDVESEKKVSGSKSKVNHTEVEITMDLLKHFHRCQYDMRRVSVISMYEGQVALLQKSIKKFGDSFKDVSVGTVDSNQGSENHIIILNMVRSNSKASVGFLCDARRINVAMSRPKDYLLVITDLHTMQCSNSDTITSLRALWKRDDIGVVSYTLLPSGKIQKNKVVSYNKYMKGLENSKKTK